MRACRLWERQVAGRLDMGMGEERALGRYGLETGLVWAG